MISDNNGETSKVISFEPSLNWFVMLAGKPPSKDEVIAIMKSTDKVLAIDGGASILLERGIVPDIAIGDFDSILPKDLEYLREINVPLVTFKSDKDFTDLELGLKFLVSMKASSAKILGASDRHPDHHLANYMAISLDAFRSINLEILNPPFRSFVVREGNATKIEGNPGDLLSIIPLSDEVEIELLSGVKWEVNNLKVIRGEARTLRNQLSSSSATLLTTKGKSIVVHKYE